MTTGDPYVAAKVARLLGGTPRPVPGAAGLEVVTDAASVHVSLDRRRTTRLGFTLEGSTGLGRFDFSPAPWTVEQITRTCTRDGATGAGGWDTRPQLIIKPVEIRTRTGLYAVHLLPVLMLPRG
ncbi:hypothetical protein ABZ901_11915 [Actinacidiphila alni]|uniref:hypothetical protein n=1 Tax=Actinacidiphila alni TaxID=380248 RepID=UPI00340AA926